MTEFWFDIDKGKLLIGDAAVEAHVAEGGHMADLQPLPDLLAAEDFTYTREQFGLSLRTARITTEDCVSYGHWVLSIVKSDYINREQLLRLYKLGLGPGTQAIQDRFNGLSNFNKELGAISLTAPKGYSTWSTADFISYARQVATETGRKPSRTDYHERAIKGEGPGYDTITVYFRGIGRLHELIGYPHIRSWTEDDYILWGSQALEANKDRGLTLTVLNILSKEKRGPSPSGIAKLFGSLSEFQRQARKVYEERQAEILANQVAKKHVYMDMVQNGRLPADFAGLEDSALLQRVARYLVAQRCAPELKQAELVGLATHANNDFLRILGRINRNNTPGMIETTAERLDLFDDIWPPDYSDLRVSSASLEKALGRHARKRRKRYHEQRSLAKSPVGR